MRTASALLSLSVFTSTWSALHVGPYQLVDYLLFASLFSALIAVGVGRTGFSYPSWALAAPIAVLAVLLATTAAPASQIFLNNRFELSPPGSSPVSGFRWLIALVFMPLAIATVERHRPGTIRTLALAWTFGAAVSALVALTDYEHLTAISKSLGTYVDFGGRQAGLTAQANNVGVASALVAPVAVWCLAIPRRRLLGFMCLLLLAIGTILSGSRGGQALFVVALAVTIGWTRAGRRAAPAVVAIVCAALYYVLSSSAYVSGNANILRLFGDGTDNGQASDLGRAAVATQALHDFEYRPIAGIGLNQITAAHRIYYQILASGGLILMFGFAVYIIGALRICWRVRDVEPLAKITLISLLTWLLVGFVENNLTDRFLYVPVGIAAAYTVRYRPAGGSRRQIRAPN